MLSIEEREERKKQIGASEIYKLLNFDTQDCQNLWEFKIGLIDYEELDNEAITCGNILEEDCLKFYEESTGNKLLFNERIENPRIKDLVVSLDSREIISGIPVENKVIKMSTFEKWKAKRSYNAEWNGIKLNIPKSYYCQVQIQMASLDKNKGILNVNTLTEEEQNDPLNVTITELQNKQIPIKEDKELINNLETRAKYMLDCIKYKKRPSEVEFLGKYVF